MNLSDWMTFIGMLVTLASMAVAIHKAKNAHDSSESAKKAMQSVKFSAIAARLRFAQENIREVAPSKIAKRGSQSESRIDLIRREFDDALSALPKQGEASASRTHLTRAQGNLNSYQVSLSGTPDLALWQSLQINVQDAVSELTTLTIRG